MSGSGAWFFASSSKSVTFSDGSPRRDLAGCPPHADDVAEVDVDLVGDQLDAAAPVDEVEEGDLAHLAPCHHPSGEPELLRLVLPTRLERLGLGPGPQRSRPGRESASATCARV